MAVDGSAPLPQARLDFSFDARVAVRYDALRGHPPAVATQIGRVIANLAHASGRGPLLELGIGTGRIALPAAAAGCEVVGIDRSAEMLHALQHALKRAPLQRIHLVRGDVAALPFQRGAFVAAMATHVLHLVPQWRAVLEQLGTLVRPGGTVLLGRDWVDPDSIAGRIRTAFRETVMKLGPRTAAPAGGREVMEALVEFGATPLAVGPTEQVAAEWTLHASPRAVLEGIRSKDDAESWVLPDDVLAEVMRSLDAWAAQQWPDLDAVHELRRRFLIAVFRVGCNVRTRP